MRGSRVLINALKGLLLRGVERFPAEPWFIDAVDISAEKLSVSGWAFIDKPRADGDYSARFAFNGHPFDRVEYPLRRSDVGDCFPSRRRADQSGFLLTAKLGGAPFRDGVLEISCRDVAARGTASGRDSWYIPDASSHRNLPEEDRRFRVIGNRDATGFLISGTTDFHRLDTACMAVTGKHLWQYRRILDWGCGCGRVARHVAQRAASFYGCDIDADNVEWCAGHLPGEYIASSLRPPLPYEDSAFDLIYGISVFTHFRPELEAAWLTELSRVASPGALLLMTVHGQTTVDYSRLDAVARHDLLEDIERKGIVCSGRNDQLDGHAAHENEYVNVYHSQRYIQRNWGRPFEIIEILRGYIFTHDLVIMRKRVSRD